MPRSQAALARRRVANRARFYAAKAAAAATAEDRAVVLFDHWRALLAELPPDDAAVYVRAIAAGLTDHITRISAILTERQPR